MSERNEQEVDYGLYVALGLSLGAAFGVIFGNLALGPSVGLFVATMAYLFERERRKRRNESS
ncbi:MAG: hypothetical protein ACYC1C_17975 [Chloroflexota bacterium]